jgi:phosphoribosylaminoimidazole-succinocarboxamide synthase
MNIKGGLLEKISSPFFSILYQAYQIKNHHVLITRTKKLKKNIKKFAFLCT